MTRRYNWGHEHRKQREFWRPVVEAGEAYCSEPVCLMPSRWIPPWTPSRMWHVSHDPTGTVWLGPSHRRCNLAEAARRGNKQRARKRKPRDREPTAGRWRL